MKAEANTSHPRCEFVRPKGQIQLLDIEIGYGDGPEALFFQEPRQQASDRLGITTFLGDPIEHITMLIDSAIASISCR